MAQWASISGARPRADEWRILRAMDAAFLAAVRDKDNAPNQDAAPTGRLLTPELFDALF